MIDATTKGVAHHIRIHALGQRIGNGKAACVTGVLRVGTRAVRHDVRAVFLNRGHRAAAGAGTRAGFAARAPRATAGGIARGVVAATNGQEPRSPEQQANEKNARFRHGRDLFMIPYRTSRRKSEKSFLHRLCVHMRYATKSPYRLY
jgi:hypothetical protein